MMSEFNEFDNEFQSLRDVRRTKEAEMNSLKKVLERSKKNKFNVLPVIVSVTATIIIFILIMTATDFVPFETAETIIDHHTVQSVPNVEVTGNMFAIEYKLDNMDRGHHDYLTIGLGRKIVINPDVQTYERGDVVYHKMPAVNLEDHQISRIVGLPGETVEIKKGQVYIDNKKLDAFYSFPTVRGMAKDEYFKTINPANTDMTIDDFEESMEPILIPTGTVFILGDQWWRSIDSRIFGPLTLVEIEGIVLGYEEGK